MSGLQCSIELIYSLFLEIKGILPKRIINGELERLAERIRAKCFDWYTPRLPEITTAASLAHYGFLRSVKRMRLLDVDLTSVPVEHMASLAACVTENVKIDIDNVLNVSDLVNILDNIKCRSCVIYDMDMDRDESLALVRAMESRVERVDLWRGEVDIKALTQYNGEGRCGKVVYLGEGEESYVYEIRSWARSINWDACISGDIITIERR